MREPARANGPPPLYCRFGTRGGWRDLCYVSGNGAEAGGRHGISDPSDGWIATAGHVVLPVQKPDAEYEAAFREQATTTACGPLLQRLSAKRRRARLRAILADPANRQGVTIAKRIEVYLPTGGVAFFPHGTNRSRRSLSRALRTPSRMPKQPKSSSLGSGRCGGAWLGPTS